MGFVDSCGFGPSSLFHKKYVASIVIPVGIRKRLLYKEIIKCRKSGGNLRSVGFETIGGHCC